MGSSQHRGVPRRSQRSGLRSKESRLHVGRVARDTALMRTYGQYCPIAKGAEIFAERWTPLLVRNLLVGCDSFGAILEGAPGMPRSLLSQRLRALEKDGVIERRSAGRRVTYHLTECGR